MRRTFSISILLLVVALSSGCATRTSLYEWKDYDRQLYGYYKDPTTSQAFLAKLLTQVEALEKARQVPPPGIYAEIGTLYLEGGDAKSAIAYYSKEAAAWPESAPLMKSLISALERPIQEKAK